MDSGDPWNPNPATVSKAMAMLRGVHRVLKSDGIFISITFDQVKHHEFLGAFLFLLVEVSTFVFPSVAMFVSHSHTSGALYLMLQNSPGLWTGILLETDSITSFTS